MKNLKYIMLGTMAAFAVACGNPLNTAFIDGAEAKVDIASEKKPEASKRPKPPKPSSYGQSAKACLTEVMYFEARGTGERGMRAVGEVVLNRKNSSRFPNTVCGVIDQRYNGSCQFSYRCDGRPEVYREPAQKALATRIATTLLSNRGKDITNGALFFHAARIKPGWFATLSPRGRFGKQLFYR